MSKEIKWLSTILGVTVVLVLGFYKLILINEPERPIKNLKVIEGPFFNNVASSHSFSVGPEDAKVTVVEFFDPECEACAAVAPYIKKEMEYYKGKVRWVFRYMAYHKNSKNAIQVLEAARKQNLFLEVQHTLFENQKIWGEQQVSAMPKILDVVSKVKTIKMDQLKKDLQGIVVENVITGDMDDGRQAGVDGTPAFFVNGLMVEEMNLDSLVKLINENL